MPLHNIPLCKIKYARDVNSSATFKYDTAYKLSKNKEKMLSKEVILDINKSHTNKNFYKNNTVVEKIKNKYLYLDSILINKPIKKIVNIKNKEIKKIKSFYLNILELEAIIEESKFIGNEKDISIFIDNLKNLSDRLKDLNKNESEILLKNNKNLQITQSNKINVNLNLNRQIVKCEAAKNLKFRKNIMIEKCIEYSLMNKFNKEININKIKFFNLCKFINIDKSKFKFINKVKLKEMYVKANEIAVISGNVENINKHTIINLGLINLRNMTKDYKKILMYNHSLQNINKYKLLNSLDRLGDKENYIDNQRKLLYTKGKKDIYKEADNYLNDENIRFIFKNFSNYLDQKNVKNIFKICTYYLDLKNNKYIFKANGKLLKNIAIVNIFRNIEKDLVKIDSICIYKMNYKNLKHEYIRELQLINKNKWIEITKRWWWLKSTLPKDNLVIPNKDFIYDSSLLNNKNFEYLKFTNHPIELGKNWGIDYNIPPSAVSIEILIDLINILLMIWHSNIQGWMCCTGKEAMQFIMEILYSWYTLETSKPNNDYYRAYRWIRWEAEKVYFKEYENGLQSMGILIANLIDYIKYHHFNLVPIWRNPKAMDIEKQFNRIVQSGDILNDLDKNKGKRHYYIEEQNFIKKGVLK